MIEKTGVIGGLDLPEKTEHTRERERERREKREERREKRDLGLPKVAVFLALVFCTGAAVRNGRDPDNRAIGREYYVDAFISVNLCSDTATSAAAN